jgi:hypothetical protein
MHHDHAPCGHLNCIAQPVLEAFDATLSEAQKSQLDSSSGRGHCLRCTIAARGTECLMAAHTAAAIDEPWSKGSRRLPDFQGISMG